MLVKEYDLRCPNGLFKTISTDYEWILSKSSNCNAFGDTTTICSNNKIDNLSVVAEGKRKFGIVSSKSVENKLN
jgi:hypothetical protein